MTDMVSIHGHARLNSTDGWQPAVLHFTASMFGAVTMRLTNTKGEILEGAYYFVPRDVQDLVHHGRRP